MGLTISSAVGISAIATYEPPWVLCNDWFQNILPRKFVEHSGIVSRRISQEDEITMGVRAVENLRRETHCNLGDCAAVVFVASSLVAPVAPGESQSRKQVSRKYGQAAARQFCRRIGCPAVPVFSINWGCSGYSRAMAIVHRLIVPAMPLRSHQFILVVTVNRTSKIVDFGCKQTAPVFGDMAQATLLARVDSRQHPVHFALVHASAENRPVGGVFFDFHWRENVLVPTPDGGRSFAPAASGVFAEHDGHRRRGPAGHGRRHRHGPADRRHRARRSRLRRSAPGGCGDREAYGHDLGPHRRPRRSDQWTDAGGGQRQFLFGSLRLEAELVAAQRHDRLPHGGRGRARPGPSVARLRHSPGDENPRGFIGPCRMSLHGTEGLWWRFCATSVHKPG